MQDLIKAFLPIDSDNYGVLIVMLWIPFLVIAAVVIRIFCREKVPRDFKTISIGMFLSMALLALIGGWQAFDFLPLAQFGMLTAIQAVIVLLAVLVARASSKTQAAASARNFLEEWERRRRFIVVGLLVLGLLGIWGGVRCAVSYASTDAANATVLSYEAPASGRLRGMNAEWAAPDGKKVPVTLVFDKLDAFRPAVTSGLELPIRINTAEVAAGKTAPLYRVDLGLVVTVLDCLSILVCGISALAALAMMRREKTG